MKLTRYEAPKARLFSLIIDGILTRKLPWDLVLLGVVLALMLEMCGGVRAALRGGRVPAHLHHRAALRRRHGPLVGGAPPGRAPSRTRVRAPCSPPGTSRAARWPAWSSTSCTSRREGRGSTRWTSRRIWPAGRGGSPGWWRRSGDSPRAQPVASIVLGLVLFCLLALHLGRVALRTREANRRTSGLDSAGVDCRNGRRDRSRSARRPGEPAEAGSGEGVRLPAAQGHQADRHVPAQRGAVHRVPGQGARGDHASTPTATGRWSFKVEQQNFLLLDAAALLRGHPAPLQVLPRRDPPAHLPPRAARRRSWSPSP